MAVGDIHYAGTMPFSFDPEVEEACPATFSLEDAERVTAAEWSRPMRDAGSWCHFDLWLRPGDCSAPGFRTGLLAGFNNCLSLHPGCRYIGAFLITDHEPPPDRPGAAMVIFSFVKD